MDLSERILWGIIFIGLILTCMSLKSKYENLELQVVELNYHTCFIEKELDIVKSQLL